MKKLLFFIITGAIILLPIHAQANFSGSADISIFANLPEPDSFSSLLSRVDLGVEDIAMMPSLIAKLDAEDKKTTFTAWFSMKEYPVGQGFLVASNDSIATNEFITAVGDKIYNFDLMRLSANVYLTDNLSLQVGRQSMLTGYGYGWNPIDFANPLKNPADPDADLRGVDAVVLRSNIGNSASLKVYALMPAGLLKSGLDYEEVKAGAETVFNLPGMEFRLAGFWDYDNTMGSDVYTPAAGSAVMLDLFGIGVYGEAAARKGSRSYSPDGMTRNTDWLFSGLAGLEYTFESELYAVVEYFYNGEGFDESERLSFKDTLQTFISTNGAPSVGLMATYSPGYFAQHYIMISLMQPFYDLNTDLNLSVLYSPDSSALTLMPSINYSFSGNFSAKLAYTGMFDFSENDFNEITALPVRHIVSTVFTYSY